VSAGLRLADLAFEGCSVGYLSHIERGRRVPSLQVVRELARRLDVPEAWLATGADRQIDPDPLVEAEAALRFDDLATAERLFGAALGTASDRRVRARARAGLGQLAFLRDDPRAAIEELEAARALAPCIEAEASYVDTLGRAYAAVGEPEEAVRLFRERLQVAEGAGQLVDRVRFSVLLANALIDLSAFTDASEVLGGVVGDTLGEDPVLLARLYWSQSRLHAMKKETARASQYARRALELLEATEFTQYRSRAHHLLAFIEIDAGHHEQALELIEHGRELALHGGTDLDAARFDLEEARARAALGELEIASLLVSRAARVLVDLDPIDVGRCYAELAAVCSSGGELERSRELYELALEYLEQRPNKALADACERFVDVLERLGDRDAAYAVMKRGLAVTAELSRRT
jgi:tetratricopeptide (TPR) repeat protein